MSYDSTPEWTSNITDNFSTLICPCCKGNLTRVNDLESDQDPLFHHTEYTPRHIPITEEFECLECMLYFEFDLSAIVYATLDPNKNPNKNHIQ
jgi:uncharacterized protein YbaR (Trm112 family)